MHRRRTVKTLRLAAAAIAVAAALTASGCSPGGDYPSLFPAVHDMPPPRADSTMDPVQVQQATEDLISERNHLSTEAQGAQQAETPPPGAAPNGEKPQAEKPQAGKLQSARQLAAKLAAKKQAAASANSPRDPASATQTAGAESK